MKRLFALLLTMCVVISCSEFEEPVRVDTVQKESTLHAPQTRTGSETTFETLPDPYALENMQAVYDEYLVDTALEPTDLYVRFLPADSLQWGLLEEEYDLALFDFPLDLDIPNGAEYVDPTISEGQIPWQYTTVKPDFAFPEDIVYEIIRECYIPEDGEVIENISLATRAAGEVVDVEKAAYERLGYVVEPVTRSGDGGGFYSEGTVEMWDDSKKGGDGDWEPLKGVRVKINSHTKIDLGAYTDKNGHYKATKKFWQENIRYTVVFHNKHKDFWLWEGLGNRAKYDHGKHHKSGCDIQISEGGMAWQWAAVNNAAWDYYEMCASEKITAPPADLKIWVQPNNGASSASMLRRVSATGVLFSLTPANLKQYFIAVVGLPIAIVLAPFLEMIAEIAGLKPDLTIGTYDENYSGIYNAVNHELSHASHFSQVGDEYWRRYIKHIADSYLRYGKDYTYGYENTSSYAGNCQVGEIWGNAMGAIEMSEKFNPGLRSGRYNIYFKGRGGKDDLITDDWIHPDPIWALITRGVLTKKQVFDCLTSDVDTKAKLIDKMCEKYPDKEFLIKIAFAADDVVVPTITGAGSPSYHTYTSYSIDSNLPAGVTFSGWTVRPASFTTTGAMTDPVLNISFSEANSYAITAEFALPDGTAYSVDKSVEVVATSIIGRGWVNGGESSYNLSQHHEYFNGWSVTGGNFEAPDGLNDMYLTIRFKDLAQYTITANIGSPDGTTTYSISRVITAGIPKISGPATATANTFVEYSIPLFPGFTCQWHVFNLQRAIDRDVLVEPTATDGGAVSIKFNNVTTKTIYIIQAVIKTPESIYNNTNTTSFKVVVTPN